MVKDWALKGPAYYAPRQGDFSRRRDHAAAGELFCTPPAPSRGGGRGNRRVRVEPLPRTWSLSPSRYGLVPGAWWRIGLDGCMRPFHIESRGEAAFSCAVAEEERWRKQDGRGMAALAECSAGKVAGDNVRREPRTFVGAARRRRKRGRRRRAEARSAIFQGRQKRAEHPAAADTGRAGGIFGTALPSGPTGAFNRCGRRGVYLLPAGMGTTARPCVFFLRTGLLLGELKKGAVWSLPRPWQWF